MRNLIAGISGLVFGLGLILSGMTDPHKVLGFLDITGLWDPSLAFVMGGAVLVAALAFAITGRCGALVRLPVAVDRRLLLGAVLFGIGWGLAGICPGPAIVLLGSGSSDGAIFAIGMVGGMGLFSLLDRRIKSGTSQG